MISTPAFSDRVQTTWLEPFSHLRRLVSNDAVLVAVDPELGSSRRCRVLDLDSGGLCVTLSDDLATEIEPFLEPDCDIEAFHAALEQAGVELAAAESEEIFYFTAEDEDQILAEAGEEAGGSAGESGEPTAESGEPTAESHEPTAEETPDSTAPVTIRPLDADDIKSFAVFQAANTADDLDEAFVELDHWAAVGAFAGDGELAAVATAYPWRDHPVADIGVLTSPDHRGQKLGSAVVRAVARRVLERGYSPQYRCEGDNDASRATAASAGLSHFATMSIIR